MSEPHVDGLPQRLKAATRDWHARAERSGVMAELLGGTIDRDSYVALLVNLYAIYRALETALALMADRPPVLDTLARSAALAADLRAFGAPSPTLVPAAHDYAHRIQAMGAENATRLWGHVYVRYLGDLHGGQILSRMVRTLFGVAHGTTFYDFGDDAHVRALRDELRAQLGALRLTGTQADELVDEAVWAFEAHCRIFDQIQSTN